MQIREENFLPSQCETDHGSSISWWQVLQRGHSQASSGWNHPHAGAKNWPGALFSHGYDFKLLIREKTLCLN